MFTNIVKPLFTTIKRGRKTSYTQKWDNTNISVKTVSNSRIVAKISSITITILLLLTTILGVLIPSNNSANADFIRYTLCSWGKDAKRGKKEFGSNITNLIRPGTVYEITQTDDVPQFLYSKSAANAEATTVNTEITNLISGRDYAKPTIDIINNSNNTAKKYTPYDRFGFSGLKWSNYLGEFNWIKVYYCGDDGYSDANKDPEDWKLNAFYEKRNRPLDSFGDIGSSEDPRVSTKLSSIFLGRAGNYYNIVGNIIFFITKCIVAFNNLFIDKSMSNIAVDMGLTRIVKDVMSKMFDSLYFGLLPLAILALAGYMIWVGLAKRRFHDAFRMIVKALLLIFVACIMKAAPALVVNLPNNIGVLVEYEVFNLISDSKLTDSTSDMCSTTTYDDKDGTVGKVVNPDNKNGGDDGGSDVITQMVKNLGDANARVMTCQYWRLFALTPWSIGQFGTVPKNLYAKGYAKDGGHDINYSFIRGKENTQSEYPGSAAVPLGNNTVYHNWAVYQMGVQSSAHISSLIFDNKTGVFKERTTVANIGEVASKNRLISGTYGDFWRVVDVVSGWDTVKNSMDKGSTAMNADLVDSEAERVQKPGTWRTDYWNSWIGAKLYERFGTALVSIIACIALIAPLVIGGSIVLASLISVLLMAFAPVIMLVSVIPNYGDKILKRWIMILYSTIIKRLALSVLYVFVLVVTCKIMDGITGAGDYLEHVLIIIFFTLAILKLKPTVVRIIAGKMGADSEGLDDKMAKMGHSVKNVAVAAGVGAVMGAKGTKVKDSNGFTQRDSKGHVIRERAVTADKNGKRMGTFHSIMASSVKQASKTAKHQAGVEMRQTEFGRRMYQDLAAINRRKAMVEAQNGKNGSNFNNNNVGGNDDAGKMRCQASEHADTSHIMFAPDDMFEVNGIYVCSECYNNFYC